MDEYKVAGLIYEQISFVNKQKNITFPAINNNMCYVETSKNIRSSLIMLVWQKLKKDEILTNVLVTHTKVTCKITTWSILATTERKCQAKSHYFSLAEIE